MSALDGLPLITDQVQEVGVALLACELCPEKIPVPVHIWIGKDDDGDDCVWTEPSVFDLELHMLTHDLGGPPGDDED